MPHPLDLLDLGGPRRTPYIAQSEGSECALACLAMVASYHGYETDLGALRQRYSLSLKGATLKQVMGIAEQIGFNTRGLRGELEDLPHLACPAILHWNLNHFVVLTKISGNRYHIHDPAASEIVVTGTRMTEAEMAEYDYQQMYWFCAGGGLQGGYVDLCGSSRDLALRLGVGRPGPSVTITDTTSVSGLDVGYDAVTVGVTGQNTLDSIGNGISNVFQSFIASNPGLYNMLYGDGMYNLQD